VGRLVQVSRLVAVVAAGCTGVIACAGEAEVDEGIGAGGARGAEVSDINGAADTGCLDAPGSAAATAAEWYREDAAGTIALVGDERVSDGGPEFVEAASAAVAANVDHPLALEATSELSAAARDCVTHRYATFSAPDGTAIVVTAWRLEHTAAPSLIASEAGFVAGDDTVVSDGLSIKVALVVAPDGSTARASAYGRGARERVSGWPTTMPLPPAQAAIAPGPAPADVDELTALARTVLAEVLDR
jgi:hypothetical protein